MNWGILAATAKTAAPGPQQVDPLMQILPWVLIFGVLWFFMIAPQKKQQKQRKTMLESLKKGDKIITIGGIHGEIIELDEEDVKVRISDKTEVKFTKSAIARVKS